jgi:hypothetical protein
VGHAALAMTVKPTKKSLPTLQRKRLVFLSGFVLVFYQTPSYCRQKPSVLFASRYTYPLCSMLEKGPSRSKLTKEAPHAKAPGSGEV